MSWCYLSDGQRFSRETLRLCDVDGPVLPQPRHPREAGEAAAAAAGAGDPEGLHGRRRVRAIRGERKRKGKQCKAEQTKAEAQSTRVYRIRKRTYFYGISFESANWEGGGPWLGLGLLNPVLAFIEVQLTQAARPLAFAGRGAHQGGNGKKRGRPAGGRAELAWRGGSSTLLKNGPYKPKKECVDLTIYTVCLVERKKPMAIRRSRSLRTLQPGKSC